MESLVRMPRNFPGILVAILMLLVLLSRSVPRSLLSSYSLGVVGPIIAVAAVLAFVIALASERSDGKKGHRPPRRKR